MRALHATVVGLLASSIAGAGTACRQRPSASRAADADALVTVYVPARMADQVMGPLQAVAAPAAAAGALGVSRYRMDSFGPSRPGGDRARPAPGRARGGAPAARRRGAVPGARARPPARAPERFVRKTSRLR